MTDSLELLRAALEGPVCSRTADRSRWHGHRVPGHGQPDQKLYLWNNPGDGTNAGTSTGVLLSVNPSTGKATLVNTDTPNQGALGALAFSPGGALYGVLTDLFSVDPATGVKTLLGSLGSGLRLAGADFDCNGTLYGVEFTSESTQRLVTINLTTGAATVVATLNVNIGRIGSILFLQSGTLLGASSGGPHGDMLFDLDPVSGAVSNIRGTSFIQGLAAARTCDIIG